MREDDTYVMACRLITHWCIKPGSAFIKPDQHNPWIKDQLGKALLFIWSLIHGSSWSGLIKAEPDLGCNTLLISNRTLQSWVVFEAQLGFSNWVTNMGMLTTSARETVNVRCHGDHPDSQYLLGNLTVYVTVICRRLLVVTQGHVVQILVQLHQLECSKIMISSFALDGGWLDKGKVWYGLFFVCKQTWLSRYHYNVGLISSVKIYSIIALKHTHICIKMPADNKSAHRVRKWDSGPVYIYGILSSVVLLLV